LARAAKHLAKGGLPPLVLMTDDDRLADPIPPASALPRGSMIVVRSRDEGKRRELGRALLKLARRMGYAVLIADDPLLAVDLGADGIHLPEARMREAAYWHARFPAILITSSAHSLRAVTHAGSLPLDAVFVSPVFPTQSHAGRPALLPMRASSLSRAARKPVYALGGIDARNALRLAHGGFAGLAAIAALAV
jgi:thiamine-phosphate pyrophosphorylase